MQASQASWRYRVKFTVPDVVNLQNEAMTVVNRLERVLASDTTRQHRRIGAFGLYRTGGLRWRPAFCPLLPHLSRLQRPHLFGWSPQHRPGTQGTAVKLLNEVGPIALFCLFDWTSIEFGAAVAPGTVRLSCCCFGWEGLWCVCGLWPTVIRFILIYSLLNFS